MSLTGKTRYSATRLSPNLSLYKMDQAITDFLSAYDMQVQQHTLRLRQVILDRLPGITEQLDIAAGMIAYSYGQRYTDLVCVLIPSRKGLKLGFNKGSTLPDPDGMLEGKGKTSRYVVIRSEEHISSAGISHLLSRALEAYRDRMNN